TALGSTTVSATIPGFIATTSASQSVTVTQPAITLNTISNVGAGLQGSGNSALLSASQHGGVTAHVESANPSVALVAPNPTTVGSASFDVFLANGSTSVTFYVSGMENVTGTSLITVSAPGFTSSSKTATIVQPGLLLSSLGTTIDTLAPVDPFWVTVGLPSGGTINPVQAIRAGGTTLVATIKNSNHPVGDLVTTPLTGDSVVVSITPGNSTSPGTVATGGVAFDGTALGSTTVSATIPGLIAVSFASQTVTVTQPTISLNPLGTVGAGLQGQANSAFLSVSNHGGVTVHIASANPSVALVAPNASTAGSASIDVFVANGSASATFYVSGMENVTGTSVVTASAPGFISASQTATIAAPALDFTGLASAFDATDPNDPFQVRVGLPGSGNTTVNPLQSVRAGSPGVTATITLTNAVAGQLVTTLATNDTVTVHIAAGASSSGATVATGGVAFDPLAPGTTLVAATIPGFTPMGAATQQIVVSQRIVTMGAVEDVGAGLQSGVISAVLGLAQHGGVTVHVASSDPSVALLAPNFSTPGSAALDFPLSNGSTQISFYVQGLAIGTSTITASVPTFTSAVRVANIVQPALEVALLADTLMDNDANDPFVVRVGIPSGNQATVATTQFVRPGGPTLSATVSNLEAAYATLVTDTQNGSPVVVTIAAGESQSAASAVLGGVEFDPLYPGPTTVSAAIPNFIATTAASKLVVVKPHLQPTGVGNSPVAFALHANVPNPFNPITTISYDVPARGADVNISIYDVSGRLVRGLVHEHRAAGVWSAQWNGEDDRGQHVASGVYFYRMRAGEFVDTKKMVLLK
ncbi:MAG TPA: FlgD immunoglobulin-like domain containing protein, partial [Candidatus Krumholzibacteria bacterium]|nr:FlgD immunoglobulin-like domain containing protein [Candidatus Krumholzibacteria bacterium]